ncbi:MAG: hypothetical protein HYZ28_22360 [Myxococcales bacterium]|nr:hypothetical protein [Myxococcales bacterium]
MGAIGLFSDSHGDLRAFDRAYELLKGRGAKRFVFPGGRFTDLDEWVSWRKEKARGGRSYSDTDFLADVEAFLSSQEQVPRPPAFGEGAEEAKQAAEIARLRDRFLRTPERDCLQYRDPQVPKKALELVGDALCCVVYDRNDLEKEDLLNAAVFIHGKDPEPKVVQIGPRYFVTAGKLTGAAEQTCALLEPGEGGLRFTAFTLDGRELVSGQQLALSAKTKLSVK